MLVSAWGETKDKQNLQALDQEGGREGEVERGRELAQLYRPVNNGVEKKFNSRSSVR